MEFNLKQPQIDYIGACEQFVAYVGAIGTGKSSALILKALLHSQESPNNLGIIIRKNFTDLRDSTIKDYETYTGRKVNESKKEDVLPNGSVILFRHGDELPVLKNINAGFFAIEQAEEFGDSMAWDMLIMRLRRQVKHRTGFLVANANGHNWIYDKFIRNGAPNNHLCVQAKTEEFSDILPPDYISNLKQNLPDRLYRRFVLNSHEVSEGRVYDEYDDSEHVVEPFDIPESWERGFVLDHGFRNPTAVLWYAINHDGIIYLYDEHYECEKPVSYHSSIIKGRGLTSGLCDPSIMNKTQSRGNYIYSIADEYRDNGINLSPALREEEYAAIGRVNEFFKSKRVMVFRTLSNTRNEFCNWKWRPVRPGADPKNMPEEPEDYRNHLCDDLKYLIQSRFPASSNKDKEKLPRYCQRRIDIEIENEKEQNTGSLWTI